MASHTRLAGAASGSWRDPAGSAQELQTPSLPRTKTRCPRPTPQPKTSLFSKNSVLRLWENGVPKACRYQALHSQGLPLSPRQPLGGGTTVPILQMKKLSHQVPLPRPQFLGVGCAPGTPDFAQLNPQSFFLRH